MPGGFQARRIRLIRLIGLIRPIRPIIRMSPMSLISLMRPNKAMVIKLPPFGRAGVDVR